jgi:hypothetical protein
MQATIDGVNQPDVLSEFVEQGDTAESGAIDPIVEFEVNVSAAAKDGPGEVGKFGFVETSQDTSFASFEFVA